MKCYKCKDGNLETWYSNLDVYFGIDKLDSDGSIYTDDIQGVNWNNAEGPFLYCSEGCSVSLNEAIEKLGS